MSDNSKNKDIELRSEKVRNIVGKVPPLLLRIGISIISAIIMLVLTLAYLIPYPEYEDITVCLYSDTPVHIKKSLEAGFFYAEFLNRHANKGEQTGVLVLETDNDSILPSYAEISGDIYYQLDYRTHVEKGDILYVIIPDSVSEIYGVFSIPYNETGKIEAGQKVSVTLENKKKGFIIETLQINGYIRKIYPFADSNQTTHENYYKVEISGFPDSLRRYEDKCFLFPNEKYNGKILLSDKPVLKKILEIW